MTRAHFLGLINNSFVIFLSNHDSLLLSIQYWRSDHLSSIYFAEDNKHKGFSNMANDNDLLHWTNLCWEDGGKVSDVRRRSKLANIYIYHIIIILK